MCQSCDGGMDFVVINRTEYSRLKADVDRLAREANAVGMVRAARDNFCDAYQKAEQKCRTLTAELTAEKAKGEKAARDFQQVLGVATASRDYWSCETVKARQVASESKAKADKWDRIARDVRAVGFNADTLQLTFAQRGMCSSAVTFSVN